MYCKYIILNIVKNLIKTQKTKEIACAILRISKFSWRSMQKCFYSPRPSKDTLVTPLILLTTLYCFTVEKITCYFSDVFAWGLGP